MKRPIRLAACAAVLLVAGAAPPAHAAGAGARRAACPGTAAVVLGRTGRMLAGRLAPACSAVTYRFTAPAGATLSWTYRGPMTRFLLEKPDGDVDGPGLTSPARLSTGGTYGFSLASNRMAERIYGRYRLRLTLTPP